MSRYAHARQMKRARACTRKLRTQLGRAVRQIERQVSEPSEKLSQLLATAHRIHAQQRHDKNKVSLSHGQKYVLRELRAFVASLDENDERRDGAGILEKAFRSSYLSPAAKRELAVLRWNHVVGDGLYRSLGHIYEQHNRREQSAPGSAINRTEIPRLICSEALM